LLKHEFSIKKAIVKNSRTLHYA